MAISKNKKVEVVGDIANIAKDSKTLVFVNFHGLNVTDLANK